MAYELVVPELSESVVEATVSEWMKNEGDKVNVGDVVVVLETDKVSVEVTAEQAGVLSKIQSPADEDVVAGDVLGLIEANGDAPSPPKQEPAKAEPKPEPKSVPVAVPSSDDAKFTPVAKRFADANNVDIQSVSAQNGQKVTKEDVENHLQKQQAPKPTSQPASGIETLIKIGEGREEEREKMSRRRRTIAKRLVEAQQTTAMLTTFNEIDMTAVMELRKRRKEAFKEKHGVSLGLSSFFVKATIGALKAFPRLNAEIDGDYIIMKPFYDIGIAIGAEEGLIVPVLRDADRMSFAEIEGQIRQYAKESQEGTISIESLMGGTFTITNGGIFGSMMSTPILNAPQVGILGLHGIKDRPVVIDGEIVIRAMMYVALTYDHRIVDGREAVQFLVKVKDLIEDPESLLIEG